MTRLPPTSRISSSSSSLGDHIEVIRSTLPSSSHTPPNSQPSAAQTACASRSAASAMLVASARITAPACSARERRSARARSETSRNITVAPVDAASPR